MASSQLTHVDQCLVAALSAMNSSYINHKVVNYITNDDETQNFIKSDFYKKIKDVYTK